MSVQYVSSPAVALGTWLPATRITCKQGINYILWRSFFCGLFVCFLKQYLHTQVVLETCQKWIRYHCNCSAILITIPRLVSNYGCNVVQCWHAPYLQWPRINSAALSWPTLLYQTWPIITPCTPVQLLIRHTWHYTRSLLKGMGVPLYMYIYIKYIYIYIL